MLYRFRCWEQHDTDYLPSLVASCRRSGRLAYFDTIGEITFDITSMAPTQYEVDGQPLIALSLSSQSSMTTIYAMLDELANEIAAAQDDKLWRLLRMTTRTLPEKHRIV